MTNTIDYEDRIVINEQGHAFQRPRTTWFIQDITRDHAPIRPAFLYRDDGLTLIYPGMAHSFVGESETLKSWAALLACRSVVERGGNVLYIDFESSLRTFQKRARIVGLPLDPTRVGYVRPDEPLDVKGVTGQDLGELGDLLLPRLVVIDGVTEAFSLHGWDTNSATDAAKYHDLLLRRPTRAGAATLEVDHAPHSGARQLGTQHKRAGIDGASYLFTKAKPGGAGKLSTAEVVVLKDREGEVRGELPDGKTVGTFRVDTRAGESDIAIAAPTYTSEADRIAEVAEACSRFLEEQDGPVSQSEVERGVDRSAAAIREALDFLVDGDFATRSKGPRNAKMYRSPRPYRQTGS